MPDNSPVDNTPVIRLARCSFCHRPYDDVGPKCQCMPVVPERIPPYEDHDRPVKYAR